MRIVTLAIVALAASSAACAQDEPSPAIADTVEGAYRQALALSPLRYEVEAQHRYRTATPIHERSDDASHLETLQRRIRQDQKAAAARTTPAELNVCVDVVVQSCAVQSAGFMRAGPDRRIWWQIQDGFTDEDGVGGGVIVFEEIEGGALKPILWTFEGWRYENPFLEPHGDGQWLLIVPGLSRGTGSGDMTVMMLWRDGAWRAVDMDWQSRVGDQLGGLKVRHQPQWRFPRLEARSQLWRPDDGGCCGRGGDVLMDFDVVNDQLVVTNAEITPPARAD
ncbi:MAG: hypothetical protein KJ824_12095 [Alphaproteobacteria bacterium]|nr:hypothetical protein [Alphaproteobacteria bacterium]